MWADRVAEVIVGLPLPRGRRRGSGYLVAPDRVLTAAHVVADATAIRVRFDADQPGERTAEAEVVWAHPGIDVAVLVLPADRAATVEAAEFGRVGRRANAENLHCTAVGFPWFKLRGTDQDEPPYRDCEQVHATCAPLSNRREGTLDLVVPPPAPHPERGASPWEGMSGAAVFSGGRIIGVITAHHLADGLGRLAASRVDRWAERLEDGEVRTLETLLGCDLTSAALPDVTPPPQPDRLQAGYDPSDVSGPGVAAVPIDEAVRDPRPVFDNVLDGGFTGRAWVVEQIEAFLGSRPSGYLWIEADAGMGKSALAAHLVRERGWFGHFVRYARGETVRVGLQNLAGQLICHYGLSDLAPGHMLPERLFTSEGFEIVLSRAAGQARREGGRVVLVVDGADEAEQQPGALAWGLPRLLPDGVFVIGTHRTGHPPGHSDPPPAVLRIDADDERNRSDLTAYLRTEVQEGALAARLAEADVTPEQFTAGVAERSGGVWVYLRYLLREIRLGLRQAGALDELPDGLWSYYVDRIRDWSHDEHWHDGLLPLVATLTAAGEPLPVTTLAALAGVPEGRTREWCQYRLRPFLTAASGTPRRFEIYHASLREVLAGATPEPSEERSNEEQQAWADALGAASLEAHARVAERYLEYFGGLDRGVGALADDPALAGVDDGYPLRHLAGHLSRAGHWGGLHRLLRAERSAGPRRVNVWFAAHDHADTLDSYLDDIALARGHSRQRTDRALAEHRPATSLPEEIHYTLIAASLTSLTDNVPAELLRHLVAERLWRPARALAFARRLTRPESRAHALSSLVALVPTEEQRNVLDQALRCVRAIEFDQERGRALVRTVEYAPREERDAAAAEVLRIAADLENPMVRTRTLADLIPGLPESLRPEAVKLAWTSAAQIPDSGRRSMAYQDDLNDRRGYRAAAMAEVLGHLPDHVRLVEVARVLEDADFVRSDFSRVRVRRLLACQLPPGQRETQLSRAWEEATAIVNQNARVRELADLVPGLPPRQRDEAMDLILREAAGAATDPNVLMSDPLDVLRHLPAEHLPIVVEQVMKHLDSPGRAYERAGKTAILLDHLPVERRREVAERCLAEAGALGRRASGTSTLLDLIGQAAPHHQLGLAAQALEEATTAAPDRPSAYTLGRLVEQVTPEHRRTVAERTLGVVDTLTHPQDRAQALVEVAQPLPPHQRQALLDQALDTVAAVADVPARARVLSKLYGRLPAERVRAVLEQTLEDVSALTDEYRRALSLTELLGHLPEERRYALAEQMLDALSHERTPALSLLLPHTFSRFGIIKDTNEGGGGFEQREAMRSRTLTRAALVEHLSPTRRRALLEQALNEIGTTVWSSHHALVLAQLVGHFPVERRKAALAEALREADDRTRFLSDWRARERTQVLLEALQHLPAGLRPPVVEQTLAEARTIPDPEHRADRLIRLLAHLAPERRPAVARQAWEALLGAERYRRDELFRSLAPYVPGDLLAPALATVVRSPYFSVPAVVARAGDTLATDSPADYVALLRTVTRSLPRGEHLSILSRAAPALRRLAGPDAIPLISDSIVAVGRWWP
ncbi:trypsin-like peptidase domain-containing protein [Streptomyces sp. NBC_01685]|uniref:trypsin-like peptidase domain-containing protein n=1 Tax=Streptomyces sp. NBC_01685 TaxID=2975910 RepID=UPI002E36900C|nr:trypsin-like peptidase domain-containing protein [Streptomyces sp. NBC_01685]